MDHVAIDASEYQQLCCWSSWQVLPDSIEKVRVSTEYQALKLPNEMTVLLVSMKSS